MEAGTAESVAAALGAATVVAGAGVGDPPVPVVPVRDANRPGPNSTASASSKRPAPVATKGHTLRRAGAGCASTVPATAPGGAGRAAATALSSRGPAWRARSGMAAGTGLVATSGAGDGV